MAHGLKWGARFIPECGRGGAPPSWWQAPISQGDGNSGSMISKDHSFLKSVSYTSIYIYHLCLFTILVFHMNIGILWVFPICNADLCSKVCIFPSDLQLTCNYEEKCIVWHRSRRIYCTIDSKTISIIHISFIYPWYCFRNYACVPLAQGFFIYLFFFCFSAIVRISGLKDDHMEKLWKWKIDPSQWFLTLEA